VYSCYYYYCGALVRRNKVFIGVGSHFFFFCEGGCNLSLVAVMTQASIRDHVVTTGNPVAAFSSFFY